MSDVLMTMAEVAKFLHCSRAHVCNAVNGRLEGCTPIPAIRLGRRLLVRRDSLDLWLQENEANATRETAKASAG